VVSIHGTNRFCHFETASGLLRDLCRKRHDHPRNRHPVKRRIHGVHAVKAMVLYYVQDDNRGLKYLQVLKIPLCRFLNQEFFSEWVPRP